MTNTNHFSIKIRRLRKEQKFSTCELVSILNVSNDMVKYWEKGAKACPHENLISIAKFLLFENYGRAKRLKGLFEKLNLPTPSPKFRIPIYVTIREKYGIDIRVCPKCNEHHLEPIATHYRSGSTIMKDNRNNNFRNKASPTDF